MLSPPIGRPKSGTFPGPMLQRRLVIGASHDPLEREADRAAGQALGAPLATDFARVPITAGGAAQSAPSPEPVPASVHRALAGPGRPLDPPLRSDMEARFGRDFSQVRVHSDAQAADSAADVGARAYTAGPHVVFGMGRFAPATGEGRSLLAHELVHVVQQGSGEPRLRRAPEPAATIPLSEPEQALAQPLAKGKPLSAEGEALAKELDQLIAETEWERIRERLYAPASAGSVERAKQRRLGLLPDLQGLGAIKSLDEFAVKVRSLQADWPSKKTEDERVQAIHAMVNQQLDAAKVYPIKKSLKAKMPEHANFNSRTWQLKIQEGLVSAKILAEEEAARLANTLLHECRHAEQAFLAARFAAGRGDTAAEIADKHEMFAKAAERAVELKFDSGTDKETRKLGRQMFRWGALQGNRADKRTEALRTGINKKLKSKRAAAERAVKALRAGETKTTLDRAANALAALKEALPGIERQYARYRSLREEADAHEVGDAEEVAFKASK